MTDTKFAITAVMALTFNSDRGPEWVRALVAIFQFGCTIYLGWYLWFGPDVIERRAAKKRAVR